MNLYPIAEHLENSGLGVMAESIFINAIPIEAPEGILLRNKLQGTKIDYELPGYYKGRFQLVVRAKSYPGGDEKMKAVFEALTMDNVVLGPMTVYYVRPVTMPVVFPLSKGNLLEFAADFDIVFVEA